MPLFSFSRNHAKKNYFWFCPFSASLKGETQPSQALRNGGQQTICRFRMRGSAQQCPLLSVWASSEGRWSGHFRFLSLQGGHTNQSYWHRAKPRMLDFDLHSNTNSEMSPCCGVRGWWPSLTGGTSVLTLGSGFCVSLLVRPLEGKR